MQSLIEAGIDDLGGTGELLLEIEYNSPQGFKEAFYRLPVECNQQDIVRATLLHLATHTTLTLEFNSISPFVIDLKERCKNLVEVRLENTIGGRPKITHLFYK